MPAIRAVLSVSTLVFAASLMPALACARHEGGVRSAGDVRPTLTDEAGERQPDLSRAEELILRQTNEFRAESGLRELERNARLDEAAEAFAQFMARTTRYGHTADGREPSDRAAAAGYDYCIISENIGYMFNSDGYATKELAGKFIDGWKESPPHRKAMLDPDTYEIGVAVAHSPANGYYYGVQLFGRPESRRIAFQIANRTGEDVSYDLGGGESFTLRPRQIRSHFACRPPTVRLGEGQDGMVLRPDGGTRYVLRQGDAGELAVETRTGVEIHRPRRRS